MTVSDAWTVVVEITKKLSFREKICSYCHKHVVTCEAYWTLCFRSACERKAQLDILEAGKVSGARLRHTVLQ